MQAYVKDNFGNRLSASENARLELEFLRRVVPNGKAAIGDPSPSKVSTIASDDGRDCSMSDSSDDVDDTLPDCPADAG